jgi:hypothetical protein
MPIPTSKAPRDWCPTYRRQPMCLPIAPVPDGRMDTCGLDLEMRSDAFCRHLANPVHSAYVSTHVTVHYRWHPLHGKSLRTMRQADWPADINEFTQAVFVAEGFEDPKRGAGAYWGRNPAEKRCSLGHEQEFFLLGEILFGRRSSYDLSDSFRISTQQSAQDAELPLDRTLN